MVGKVSRQIVARAGVVLILSALMAGAASAPASASAAPWLYSVGICAPTETCSSSTPAVIGLNGSGATLSVTITSESNATGFDPDENGALNNFTLTAPTGSGITITGASCATCSSSPTVSSSAVSLTNLDLSQGNSVTMQVSVSTPASGCTVASPCTWGTAASYDNDGDTDDTAWTLDPTSSVNTVLAQWAITVQPADAQINTPITSTPYNTPAGSPVQVALEDSSGATVSSYNGTDEVSLTSTPSALLGGAGPFSVSSGTTGSSFKNLEVPTAGSGYTLTASSAAGFNNDGIETGAPSSPFTLHTAVSASACDGAGCSGTTTNSNSTLNGSSSATSGALVLALDPAPSFWASAPVVTACDNYKFLSGDEDTVQLLNDPTSLTIKDLVTVPEPNLAAVAVTWATQQLCLAASTPFTAAGGVPATLVNSSPTGSGTSYVGLLVSLCFRYPSAPCVTKRTFKIVTLKPLVVTFEIDATIPTSLAGDPIGHH
jgi:hypothetical protein